MIGPTAPGSPINNTAPSLGPTPRPSPNPTFRPTPIATPTAATVYTTLIATGDVMLGRMVRTESEGHGSYRWPFLETRDLLVRAEITLINLENPIVEPCPISTVGLIFCAPEASVEGLVYAGVDVANVANNHILDKEEAGYESTLAALVEAGIFPSDANHVAIIDRQGVRFGFIGFNRVRQYPDTSMLTDEEIVTRIEEADRVLDVLVVSFHWGNEFRTWVTDHQRNLAYQAIDRGADLIVGTHPHVVQSVETYHDRLIFFSLGNFVFDDMSVTSVRQGLVAVLHFRNSTMMEYELVPTTIYDYGQPRIDAPSP
jgi:poly-gamma-glutamate synthesis protein (capsule biosynthesis protein)